MSSYEDLIFTKARDGILALDRATASDIYALSFFYCDYDDDPRLPVLLVSYNTNANWRACTPAPGQAPKWPIASNSDEAKWNFAFWPQHEASLCEVGETAEDALDRTEWVRSLGLWWTDVEEKEDWDRTFLLGEKINENFVRLCLAVARRLHGEGIICGKFGRPIPILVHELEYSTSVVEATRQANPDGLAVEFEKWITNM